MQSTLARLIPIFLIISSIYSSLWLFPGCNAAVAVKGESAESNQRQATPQQITSVTLAATGDIIAHAAINRAAFSRDFKLTIGQSIDNMGFNTLFQDIKSQIRQYDFAMFNMESPLTDRPYNLPADMIFWGSSKMADALADAGFNVAVLANNHALDQGKKGLEETIKNFNRVNIKTVGAGADLPEVSTGLILEKNGIRIGIVAFTALLNNYSPAMRKSPDKPQVLFWYSWGNHGCEVLDAIRQMRKRHDVDFVLVSAHWDQEYSVFPSGYTRKIAQQLADAGADVVIGHHPHVLQPVEYMNSSDGRRCPIIYSLGNFLSNMCPSFGPMDLCEQRFGAVAVITLQRPGKNSVNISDIKFEPIWIEQSPACPGETKSAYRCIRPVLIDRQIAEIKNALPLADPAAARQLTMRLRGYEIRKERIEARLKFCSK